MQIRQKSISDYNYIDFFKQLFTFDTKLIKNNACSGPILQNHLG